MTNGIRLLILADFHYTHYGWRWERDASEDEGRVFTGPRMLERLEAVLREKSGMVDHVIIAGDLTNRGYRHEFEPIERALGVLDGGAVSVVPGNHDMSTGILANLNRARFHWRFLNYLGKYMFNPPNEEKWKFPYIKETKCGFVIVGLDTTTGIVTRYRHSIILGFSPSIGSVGAAQMRSLRDIARDKKFSDRPLVIVMHHDPFVKQNPWTKLDDLNEFKKLMDEISADRKLIVVCGHNHDGIIDYYNKNVLHIQAPAFCGQRRPEKGGFYDITIKSDLGYALNE